MILLWFMSLSVLPMFSSKNFIVLGLICRPLIHFEFIFVYGIRKCSNLIILLIADQFFIDYAKAFDCVDHNKLWKILNEMGIPDHLTCLLRNLYAGQEATVRTGHGT